VQGFMYSKPLSATDFGELLASGLAQRQRLPALANVA